MPTDAAPGRPHDRSRSRSPKRTTKPKTDRGFRWKDSGSSRKSTSTRDQESEEAQQRDRPSARDTKRGDAESQRHDRDRGDQDAVRREQRQQEDEQRERDTKPLRNGDMNVAGDQGDENEKDGETGTAAPAGPDIASKFGASAAAKFSKMLPPTNGTTTASTAAASSKVKKPKSSTSSSSSSAAAAPTGPMILVTINDRLGTKAQIPCLPSDTVGDFKKIVAMKIGRRPHEIMVKRQSERPFKDQLTLEDYGVSSGVQLDLEVDTGD